MWRTKRKVVCESSANSGDKTATCRSRRKNCTGKTDSKPRAQGKLRKFINKIGSSIESLIDATPFGVPTPCEPWSPSTDKKKALLSNPISVLKLIADVMDVYSPAKYINSFGVAVGEFASGWMRVSALMLGDVREGLVDVLLGENLMANDGISETPVMVESEDVNVPGEGTGGSFVDLCTDQPTNPARKSVSEVTETPNVLSNFLTKKIIPFIDSLTLLAYGIEVTPDDCSVECSMSSLIGEDNLSAGYPSSLPESISSDMDDFDDCPSVVTEMAMSDELVDFDDYDDDVDEYEDENSNSKDSKNSSIKTALDFNHDMAGYETDDREYVVMTDVSGFVDEEDFIDVRAELDITFRS